jgi:DUF4097 and DUF4098 domain-containing protein YvlB
MNLAKVILQPKIRILISILMFPAFSFGQQIIEKSFDLSTKKDVELELKFADDIIITNSDDNTMYFKAVIDIENGELNDAHEIDFDVDSRKIDIETDIDHDQFKKSKYIIIDGDCDHNVEHYNIDMEINYELKIPNGIKVELETISGNIQIKGFNGPMAINSISGFVDLTWGNSGADLELQTITGEIFSNLEFDKKNYNEVSYVGSDITAEYLGGGIPVKIETISSDIYLRKE